MHGNQDFNLPPRLDQPGSNGIAREQRARAIEKLLLKRCIAVGQNNIAEFAGISDTTISAWYSKNVTPLARSLAFMDLKVLPASAACVESKEILDNLLYWARIGLASVRSVDDLLREEMD